MSLTVFSILLYATIAVGWIGFLWIVGALAKEGLGALKTSRRGGEGRTSARDGEGNAGASTG